MLNEKWLQSDQRYEDGNQVGSDQVRCSEIGTLRKLKVEGRKIRQFCASKSVQPFLKYGMTDDTSVNLSGLPEMPPEFDKLMLEMAESRQKSEQAAANKKESAKAHQRVLSTIEKDLLKSQGYGNREVERDDSVSIDSQITNSTESERKRAKPGAMDLIVEMQGNIHELMKQDASVDAIDVELNRANLRAKIEANNLKAKYYELQIAKMNE